MNQENVQELVKLGETKNVRVNQIVIVSLRFASCQLAIGGIVVASIADFDLFFLTASNPVVKKSWRQILVMRLCHPDSRYNDIGHRSFVKVWAHRCCLCLLFGLVFLDVAGNILAQCCSCSQSRFIITGTAVVVLIPESSAMLFVVDGTTATKHQIALVKLCETDDGVARSIWQLHLKSG